MSKTPDVPNLAGQNPATCWSRFASLAVANARTPFMQGLIKVLKDEERLQIALYYANVSVRPTPTDAAQAAKGKVVFAKLCARCHGEQAHGSELYPRLAGQKLPYLQTSITRYRDNTGIRNNQLMTIATASLKNDDITAVAHYLTQLP
jgi:cytochrome c553